MPLGNKPLSLVLNDTHYNQKCQGQNYMKKLTNNRGFTLIEILIATVIFGLVISGMYMSYSSTQQTTINQSDLVDVQQNLRVSINMISNDIQMAAALIPSGTTGITIGSNATTLNITTVSSLYSYARLTNDLLIPTSATSTTAYPFNVSTPLSVDYFSAGDTVRIIRPQNGAQPHDVDLTVASVARNVPRLSIEGFSSPTDEVQYKAGDIITRVAAGAPDPSTIVWDLNGASLRRNAANSGANIMANNISTLTFGYILENGTETGTPTLAQLEDIRAVRITITADATGQLDGQTRQRSLSSLSYIRNSVF